MTMTLPYTLDVIKDEVCHLVDEGVICCQQPLYTLCQFIPAREWCAFEHELECHDFLLRNRIIDLLEHRTWDED